MVWLWCKQMKVRLYCIGLAVGLPLQSTNIGFVQLLYNCISGDDNDCDHNFDEGWWKDGHDDKDALHQFYDCLFQLSKCISIFAQRGERREWWCCREGGCNRAQDHFHAFLLPTSPHLVAVWWRWYLITQNHIFDLQS